MASNLLSPSATSTSARRVVATQVGSRSDEDHRVESPSDRDRSEIGSRNRSVAGDYLQLTKPGIVVMILITTAASAFIGGGLAWIDGLWLLLGTAAVAGSAGAANQIWEHRIDARMARTAGRPLPDRRIGLAPAILFAAVTGLVGSGMLAVRFGAAAALAAVTTWLVYVLIYTPLKTRTAWNTTVGALAGALPMLIGYTAAGGSIADWTAWLLVGVLFAWQYPHFMAIAWLYRRQYAEAGFRMTTTVEPTGRSAGVQSIIGSIALAGCAAALCLISGGVIGEVVGVLLVIGSTAPMLLASLRFTSRPTDDAARTLLRSSLLVLPAVVAVVTLCELW